MRWRMTSKAQLPEAVGDVEDRTSCNLVGQLRHQWAEKADGEVEVVDCVPGTGAGNSIVTSVEGIDEGTADGEEVLEQCGPVRHGRGGVDQVAQHLMREGHELVGGVAHDAAGFFVTSANSAARVAAPWRCHAAAARSWGNASVACSHSCQTPLNIDAPQSRQGGDGAKLRSAWSSRRAASARARLAGPRSLPVTGLRHSCAGRL